MFFYSTGRCRHRDFSLWQYFYETLLSKRQKGVCIFIVKEQMLFIENEIYNSGNIAS